MPCDGKNTNCERRRELLSQLKCLISSMEKKKPCEWDESACPPPISVCQAPEATVQRQCPQPCPIPLKPSKSYELRGSVMYRCECIKRNGLQDRCMMWDCMGRPECMTKLYPVCNPGRAALYKLTDFGDITVALEKFYRAEQARENALAAYCRLACSNSTSLPSAPSCPQPQNCQPPCVYPTFIQLANINEITDHAVSSLHEALVEVRYPGIASVQRGEIENSILGENKRNELLHWILVQARKVTQPETGEIPGADDESLVNTYTDMGICDNESALLGRCPMTKQLGTLKRLERLIKSVIAANGEVKTCPAGADSILDKYLDQPSIHLIPESLNLSTKIMNYNEAVRYLKERNERAKENPPRLSNLADTPTKTDNEDPQKNNIAEDCDGQGEGNHLPRTAKIVEKFCTDFQDINIWAKKSQESMKNSAKLMDDCVENIYANFTALKENLENKNEISTAVIPTSLHVKESSLEQTVENVATLLEDLDNVTKANKDCQ